MTSKLWDVKDDHAILFGVVGSAIGEQFMCLDCCPDLAPSSDFRLTKGEIVEFGLEPMCDRCGQTFDEDFVNGVAPTYSLRDDNEANEAWEEEKWFQYLDHVAENKEAERNR